MEEEAANKRTHKGELEISLEVQPIALYKIDLSNSEFGAFYRLILRFQTDPGCRDIQYFKIVGDRTYYDPELFVDHLPFAAVDFPNSLELEQVPTFFYGETSPQKYLLFREQRQAENFFTAELKFKGQFKHIFDLRSFPFDEQKLLVRIVVYRKNAPDFRRIWSARISDNEKIDNEMLALTDYAIRHASVDIRRNNPLTLDIWTQISRRPWFYTIKSTISLVIIIALGLLTFLLPFSAVPGRLAIVGSLVIATIAIQFVIAADVPRVPYTTHVDREVLATLCFLLLCSGLHGAVGIDIIDEWSAIVALSVGGFLSALFLIRPIRHWCRRRKLRKIDPLFTPPFE